MTYNEALAKRDEARERRLEAKGEVESLFEDFDFSNVFVQKMQNAEYNWGYWDAVVTIMNELKLKEIKA